MRSVGAPEIRLYRGFNPQSPTLSWCWTRGDCWGPLVPENSMVFFDTAVPPTPRDIVSLDVLWSDGRRGRVLKQVLNTPWGPYMACEQGLEPLSGDVLFGGTRVAMVTFPGWPTPSWLPQGPGIPMPDEMKRELAVTHRHVTAWLLGLADDA